MKKFTRIISVLIALIFVFGCLSVNAFASNEFEAGWYDGCHRYHITSEAYSDYYCATLICRAKECKAIESTFQQYNYDTFGFESVYGWADCGETDTFLYWDVTPDPNCSFRGAAYSSFMIFTTGLGSLSPAFTDSYITEWAED